MELNTQERKKQLVGKLPEIKSNLEVVEFLISKRVCLSVFLSLSSFSSFSSFSSDLDVTGHG